jgi:tetratricopeptide (TPR) repeat protein
MRWSPSAVTPTAKAPTISKDAGEVDLVEGMSGHRVAYMAYLEAMVAYYTRAGEYMKQVSAERELRDFSNGRKFVYLMSADLPPSSVTQPKEKIAEADALFRDGLNYFNKGRIVGIPGAYSPDQMRMAFQKFDTLIRQYPTSDRVAEAFFYAGFILKEYLKQDLQAIEYLKRAYVADPKLQQPAHYERAVVLDYRLGRRDEALEEYRKVLEFEAGYPTIWSKSNSDFATKRIRELTEGGGR